jgi:O-antigen/teichoic acid export membrane protein
VDSPSTERTREGLSVVTRGTLFLLVATLLFVAITFGTRVLVVRHISVDEWSAFAWSLTLAGFLSTFGTLGLQNAIARSLPFAHSDAERRTMVRGTLLLGTAAGGTLGIALFFVGPWIGSQLGQPDIGVALQFLAIAVASSIGAGLIASIFQGYEDVTPNALLIQIFTPGLYFVLLLVGLALPGGITFHYALVVYATSNVALLLLTVAYMAFRLRRRLPAGPRAPSALRPLLYFAGPLFVAAILSSLTGNGDTIILGLFYPTTVGDYSVSVTLARLLQVGIAAAAYIFLPVTTRFFRDGETDSIRLTYATVTKWMVLFSLPLFVLFFFLPSQSLYFVYGSQYTSIIAPLQITVVGAFASTLFGPGTATQVALGQNRLVAYNSVAAAVTDVGLALWLVPHFGAVGSAVAWATAATVSAGLPLVELAVLSDIHPFRSHSLLPLALTGIPAGFLLALLGWIHPNLPGLLLPVLALAVAGLFLLVVMLTRSVDHGDRLLLEVIERMLGRQIPLLRRVGRVLLRNGPPPP